MSNDEKLKGISSLTARQIAELWQPEGEQPQPEVHHGHWTCGCPHDTSGDRSTLSMCLDEKGVWNLSPNETVALAKRLKKRGETESNILGRGLPELVPEVLERFSEKDWNFNPKKYPLPSRKLPKQLADSWQSPNWGQLRNKIPRTIRANVADAWIFNPMRPLDTSSPIPYSNAVELWASNQIFWQHKPTQGNRSMPGHPSWPKPGYDGERGQQAFLFNDISEFAHVLYIVGTAATNDDGFPETIKQTLGQMAFASHASWHIRAMCRFHGLELVEDLGSFDRQFKTDYVFWRSISNPNGEISVNLDKLFASLRCGVGACPCQYRLPNRLIGASKLTNVLFEYRNDEDAWERFAQLVTDGSALLRELARDVRDDLRIITSGLAGNALLRTRVDPTLCRLYGVRDYVLNNKDLDVPLESLKRLGSAYTKLAKASSNDKRDATSIKKNPNGGLAGNKKTNDQSPGRPFNITRNKARNGASTAATGGANKAQRIGSSGPNGGAKRLQLPNGSNGKGMAKLASLVRENKLANGIATTYSQVASYLSSKPAPTPTPKPRKGHNKPTAGEPHSGAKRKDEIPPRPSPRMPSTDPTTTMSWWRAPVNVHPYEWVANLWSKLPVLSQRNYRDSTTSPLLNSDPIIFDCSALENDEQVSAIAEAAQSHVFRSAFFDEPIKPEKIQPVPKPRHKFLRSEVGTNTPVHQDGTNPSNKKRKCKSTACNTDAAPAVPLAPSTFHKAIGTPPVRVESRASQSDSKRPKLVAKSTATKQANAPGYGVCCARCNGLGWALLVPTPKVGAPILPGSVWLQPGAPRASSVSTGEQRSHYDRCEIQSPWLEDERRHEHSARQLRSSSFNGISRPRVCVPRLSFARTEFSCL